MRAATPGAPPFWLAYFGVENLDAALAKVGELGGAVHAGPIDISIAKIAVVADPQGAVFALYDGGSSRSGPIAEGSAAGCAWVGLG